MTSPVPPAHPLRGEGEATKDGGPTVIKSFDLGGGQRLVLETRATGNIRLTIEHPGYQETRANIDPETGTDISRALMEMSFALAIRAVIPAGSTFDLVEKPPQRGAHIKATMFHDAGAYAECGACGRYSDDPKTLSDPQPVCDCGKQHYWSGSFKAPGPDVKWSNHQVERGGSPS